MSAGLFVVFEGIDGSGTSTQARLLHAHLVASGHKTTLSAEPSEGPIGHLIREINTNRAHVSDDRLVVARQLAYLFAADRHDHLHNDVDGIHLRIQQGCIAISTRYYLSSFAYNAYSPADTALVATLNREFPAPDLTFYLDCPVDEAVRRIEADGRPPDLHETRANLLRVHTNYERAIEEFTGPLHRLDARRSTEEVHGKVKAIVAARMAGK